VQAAVDAVLVGDATLAALVDGVENIRGFEPEQPPRRFIVVGNATEEANHSLGGPVVGFGWIVTYTVHIYSYQKGDTEVLAALERVSELLNFATLTVTGYTKVTCEYASDRPARVLVETKGKQERRHIPAVFTITVRE
jgi:hypothetical protein